MTLILNAKIDIQTKELDIKQALVINAWSKKARDASAAARRASRLALSTAKTKGHIGLEAGIEKERKSDISGGHATAELEHLRAAKVHADVAEREVAASPKNIAHVIAYDAHMNAAQVHKGFQTIKDSVSSAAQEASREAIKKGDHKEAYEHHTIARDNALEKGDDKAAKYHQTIAGYHALKLR